MTKFLTTLVPDVRVKGSRTPFGLQLVWSNIGRVLKPGTSTMHMLHSSPRPSGIWVQNTHSSNSTGLPFGDATNSYVL